MSQMISTPLLIPEAYRNTTVPGVQTLALKAPIAVQFELTAGCNYACSFCYNVWKSTDDVPRPRSLRRSEKERIIRRLIEWEVFDLIFSGGEPLLDKDLPPLVALAEAGGIETSLITNGALLSLERCEELKEAGLGGIQISLHNADPEKNDWITRKQGAYRLTVEGIRNAVRVLGGERINVNMVLTRNNYLDVVATARLVKEVGAAQFSIGPLSETGAAILTGQTLRREEFQRAYRELLDARRETGLIVAISGGFPLCILVEIGEDPLEIVSNFCDAGLNQIVIAPNGDMRACVCFPHILGNILTDDPQEVWERAEFLQTLRDLEHVPPTCYNCRYVALCKGGCRAAALATYGDLQAPDPLGEKR